MPRISLSVMKYLYNHTFFFFTCVTRGSSSLSTARVRISRLFGSHLKLMFAVLMLVMVSRYLQKVESLKTDKSQVLKSNMKIHKYDSVEV